MYPLGEVASKEKCRRQAYVAPNAESTSHPGFEHGGTSSDFESVLDEYLRAIEPLHRPVDVRFVNHQVEGSPSKTNSVDYRREETFRCARRGEFALVNVFVVSLPFRFALVSC